MHYIILTALLLLLAWAPSLWVQHVLRRHGAERADLPGTGAELARHLIERLELDGVTVERTDTGRDHYDPTTRTVRLGAAHHDGRSLAAVAVATHEIGHAIQFARNEPVSRLRSRWLPLANTLKRAGILLLAALPVVAIVVAPAAMVGVVALSLVLQLAGALAYLIVLPEEWDASFGKAMPILAEGEYVAEDDLPAVRGVLKAAAWTYFAGALADLVNIGRWALILRR